MTKIIKVSKAVKLVSGLTVTSGLTAVKIQNLANNNLISSYFIAIFFLKKRHLATITTRKATKLTFLELVPDGASVTQI